MIKYLTAAAAITFFALQALGALETVFAAHHAALAAL